MWEERIDLKPWSGCLGARSTFSRTFLPVTVAEAVVEATVVIAVDVALDREAADLVAKARGELGGVEAVDGGDAALVGEKLLVVPLHVIPKHRREPHPVITTCFFGSFCHYGADTFGATVADTKNTRFAEEAHRLAAALLGPRRGSKGEPRRVMIMEGQVVR